MYPCPAPVQPGLGLGPIVLDFSGLIRLGWAVHCHVLFITWIIFDAWGIHVEKCKPDKQIKQDKWRTEWDEEL